VLPVHRTALGNLAFASAHDPDVLRALALKGAEIVVRTDAAPGWDARAASAHNRVYSIVAQGAAEGAGEIIGAARSARTAIYGPNGDVLAEAGAAWQQTVTAVLPMAYFRQTRAAPAMATALVLPAFAAYHDMTANGLT
jgi:predicted amidohydrolase